METKWAEENLQTIRTLMERSALYRRALAPIMIYIGLVGIAGGIIGWRMKIGFVYSSLSSSYDGRFALFWAGMAMVAIVGTFFLIRRQALKESEPFWSPPTRRVTEALLPAFTVGAFAAALSAGNPGPEFTLSLISIWCLTFGCAIHSAGFFMPRSIKAFGWLFIFAGCLLITGLAIPDVSWRIPRFVRSPHLLMGGIFGGLHLALGIYLYFTEKKNPVA